MKLTVLGKSPSWQDAGGACSGYLLQEEDTTVVLDCGNGVFGKLRRFVDYVDVDAVVLSHLHADHFLDLVPYAYALTYAPRQQPVPVHVWPGTDHPARPVLHAPPGAREVFRRVAGAWGNEDLIEAAFDLVEYDPRDTVEIGPLRFAFRHVPHYLPTYAMDITSPPAARAGSPTAPTARRPTTSSTSRATPTCWSSRPRCRGRSAPASAATSRRARPATTAAGPAPSGSSSPTSPTSWGRSGRASEAEATFGGPVEVAREGAVFAVRAPVEAVAQRSPA